MKNTSICASIFACALLFSPASFAAEAIGQIVSLKGTANLTRGQETMNIKPKTAIEQHDVITTEEDGIVEIRFSDASIVTVGTDSSLTIDQFVYNPQEPANNSSAMRVGSGFFHFVSGKLAREKVRIDTPVSTIGIRGTELAGEVKKDGRTLVSLVECCIDVRNSQGAESLERVGTFTEVKSVRAAPTPAALTPDWWAERAVAALGKDRESLGLSELPETDAGNELGPNNRKSFPYIK